MDTLSAENVLDQISKYRNTFDFKSEELYVFLSKKDLDRIKNELIAKGKYQIKDGRIYIDGVLFFWGKHHPIVGVTVMAKKQVVTSSFTSQLEVDKVEGRVSKKENKEVRNKNLFGAIFGGVFVLIALFIENGSPLWAVPMGIVGYLLGSGKIWQ